MVGNEDSRDEPLGLDLFGNGDIYFRQIKAKLKELAEKAEKVANQSALLGLKRRNFIKTLTPPKSFTGR